MGAIPPFIYLILALAAFAIAGGSLVWVIGYVRGKGKESPKGDERSSTSGVPTGSEIPAPAGEQELLRVSRTKRDGLTIFVQGRRYRHLREIKDPRMGRETIEALRTVLAFAEGWLPTPQQAPPHPAPRESTVDEEAFLEQLRQSNLFSTGSPAGYSQPEPLIPVEEINDLAQKRLRERPDLARQHIRLTTGVGGHLCIYVGQQTFDAVGDIPDPQIRALIQDAIREWESG